MAGLNLLDMIMSAQGGKTAEHAGAKQGLNSMQSKMAIAALLPAISSALKKNTASPQGLQGLLGALQKGSHERYLDDASVLDKSETKSDGNAILGHLFGSKDVSRAVAKHAAEKSGIGPDVLKKMLPLVAVMAMGSLAKQTREPSMADKLAGLVGGGSAKQKGGLGSLLGAALGGKKSQHQSKDAGGILGNLLDADNDGNTMDDILGMAMKGLFK